MWKVSWFYEKVHDLANFVGYTAIIDSLLWNVLYRFRLHVISYGYK